MPQITPNLWFDTESEQAAKFYCSIFPNSKINAITHYGEAVSVATEMKQYAKRTIGSSFSMDRRLG